MAVSAMRRPQQEDQTPRSLQEKATSSSRPQLKQCTRAKPLADIKGMLRLRRRLWNRQFRSAAALRNAKQPAASGRSRLVSRW